VPWASASSLAVGAGAVWVADPYAGVVWRIDPGPQPIQRTVAVEFGVDSVAADGRSVWAADSVTGSVNRIDPRTNRVSVRIVVGATPRAVALGAGRVWVAVAGGGTPGGAPRAARLPPLACGPLLAGRGASPDLLIAADLPEQGRFTTTIQPMAGAIASVLRAHHFQAGRFRLALQTCDDSIAASGGPDEGKCRSNARAYAANPAVIGVVGPINSFCAAAMLPILNRAGPVSLVSPTNTWVSLVRSAPGFPAGHLRTLYPTGRRGYARVMPAEDVILAALALAVKEHGAASAFYLANGPEKGNEWEVYFRRGARRAGLRLAGSAGWNPDAKDFRALARRVRDSGAQAVVVNGSVFFHVGEVVRDLRRVLGPRFPIFATEEALPITQLFAEAGTAARGVRIVTAGISAEHLDATGRGFVRSFGATLPGGQVSSFAIHAAAATEVLLDAIARSDGTRASVARALASTRLHASPIGPIELDRRGEPTTGHIMLVRAERGGAPAYVDGVEGGVIERMLTPPTL
jgi:branched-chain amino acid transport system substrate-binding protein